MPPSCLDMTCRHYGYHRLSWALSESLLYSKEGYQGVDGRGNTGGLVLIWDPVNHFSAHHF